MCSTSTVTVICRSPSSITGKAPAPRWRPGFRAQDALPQGCQPDRLFRRQLRGRQRPRQQFQRRSGRCGGRPQRELRHRLRHRGHGIRGRRRHRRPVQLWLSQCQGREILHVWRRRSTCDRGRSGPGQRQPLAAERLHGVPRRQRTVLLHGQRRGGDRNPWRGSLPDQRGGGERSVGRTEGGAGRRLQRRRFVIPRMPQAFIPYHAYWMEGMHGKVLTKYGAAPCP